MVLVLGCGEVSFFICSIFFCALSSRRRLLFAVLLCGVMFSLDFSFRNLACSLCISVVFLVWGFGLLRGKPASFFLARHFCIRRFDCSNWWAFCSGVMFFLTSFSLLFSLSRCNLYLSGSILIFSRYLRCFLAALLMSSSHVDGLSCCSTSSSRVDTSLFLLLNRRDETRIVSLAIASRKSATNKQR